MSDNRKKVKVHIKSTISDLVLADMIAHSSPQDTVYDEENGVNIPISELKDQVDDVIEYVTDGTLHADGKRVVVTYKECKDMGFDDASTTLSFDINDPQTVMMKRDGSAAMACLFNAHSGRQVCFYETGIIPLELAVNTKSVVNTINGNGGTISLDYVIEMRGVSTERNRFNISVSGV